MLARENPFASCHIERLAFRFAGGVSWEALLDRLAGQQWCASILGPHGSGKTTLLEQSVPHLEARGFAPVHFRLSAESGMRDKERILAGVRELRAPQFILLDGAEQLTTKQWLPLRGAIAQSAGCIVTLHRSGRFPAIYECETTPALIEDLAAELTGGHLPDGEADAIFHRHDGNVRECLRELYDRWAG